MRVIKGWPERHPAGLSVETRRGEALPTAQGFEELAWTRTHHW